MRRSVTFAAALLATSAMAAPAWAQIEGNAELGDTVDTSNAAPGADADAGEIVVTGIRASQQAAIDIKRTETAIVDAISAEDIGKLPDVTIVDALQRISGVQIQRNAGEGSTVNIRGLPQVITLLNGEQYLSPGNLGSAQPNLNDIPAQLMNGVVVYKSTDIRNALSGISGTIDLRTRRPFDLSRGLTVSGTAEYATGEETRKDDFLVSGLINYRGERAGLLLSAALSESNLGNNYSGVGGGVFGNNDWGGGGANWIAPHGYESFNRVVERDRLGISAAGQLEIGEGFTLTAEAFHTRLNEYNRAAGINISNRWSGLGWTNPTSSTQTDVTGSNGQPWLDVDEYDLDVWWLNSFSVNRTAKSRSTNFNLELDYDNDGPFTFSARAMRSDSKLRSMNGQAQGDLSNWQYSPDRAFTLFRQPADRTRGTFYPANIAALYPGQYSNGVVGSRGGRYVNPNPLGYGEDPQLHLNISGRNPVWSGFDNPISGGLGAGKTLRDYMANLDSYRVAAFSSEGNQENQSDLGVFRADGSYEFEDPIGGFLSRLDAGVRRSDRSVNIRAFHLFSSFYAGNGASNAAGCAAQWKAIDVVMDQNQCQAGEMVPNAAFNPALPESASNPRTVFQGYTVNRPTRLDEHNNAIFVDNFGSVTRGIPGVWVVDPRDFDDVKSFHEAVFGGADEVIIPGRTYDVDLKEESAYASAALKRGIFSGEIGVKAIRTNLVVRQNLTGETMNYGDTNLDIGDEVTRRSYWDFLPSVNLSLDFNRQLRARFAYSKTMIPLDLGNYGGGLTIATADSQGPTSSNPEAAPIGVRQVTSANAAGNPFLNPWRSNNFDLSLEYYLGRGTLFNVGLFKLDIHSFVTTETRLDGRFPDQDGVIRRTVPFTRPVQGDGGSLQGVELGAKVAFSDLTDAPLLRNFGFDANYTYSDSSQRQRNLAEEKIPFQDNSKHQVNLVAWYQDNHLQARIAYNYRTPRLSSTFTGRTETSGGVTENFVLPIFQDSAQYVDVNVTYNLNDRFAVYANASNLFGEVERYYFDFGNGARQYHSQNEFEPRYSAGVRVRF